MVACVWLTVASIHSIFEHLSSFGQIVHGSLGREVGGVTLDRVPTFPLPLSERYCEMYCNECSKYQYLLSGEYNIYQIISSL